MKFERVLCGLNMFLLKEKMQLKVKRFHIRLTVKNKNLYLQPKIKNLGLFEAMSTFLDHILIVLIHEMKISNYKKITWLNKDVTKHLFNLNKNMLNINILGKTNL